MAITSEVVELRKDNIRAGVPFSVDIRVMAPEEVQVAYGPDKINAIRNTDYTVSLENDGRFTVNPGPSLIAKLGDNNVVLVRRELNFLSDFRAEDAFIRERVEQAVDRAVMRDQQLNKDMREIKTNVEDLFGTVGNGNMFEEGRSYDFGFVYNVNSGFPRDFGLITEDVTGDDRNVINGNIDNGVA